MTVSKLPTFRLDGKVALITGSSTGIGRHLIEVFAEAGARVIVTSRSVEVAAEVARTLDQQGFEAVGIDLEVGSVESISRAFRRIRNSFGRVDVLVNNAGTFNRKPSVDVTEEDWDTVVDTYLKGTFFCCQEAGRMMLAQHSGKIINIASQMAFNALPGRAAYCSAKAGVVHLTRALGLEWAKNGMTVNCIAPTFTVVRDEPVAESAFRQFILDHIPMGRMAHPRDIAGAALFLASSASDFITGQTIAVDGGWLTM